MIRPGLTRRECEASTNDACSPWLGPRSAFTQIVGFGVKPELTRVASKSLARQLRTRQENSSHKVVESPVTMPLGESPLQNRVSRNPVQGARAARSELREKNRDTEEPKLPGVSRRGKKRRETRFLDIHQEQVPKMGPSTAPSISRNVVGYSRTVFCVLQPLFCLFFSRGCGRDGNSRPEVTSRRAVFDRARRDRDSMSRP